MGTTPCSAPTALPISPWAEVGPLLTHETTSIQEGYTLVEYVYNVSMTELKSSTQVRYQGTNLLHSSIKGLREFLKSEWHIYTVFIRKVDKWKCLSCVHVINKNSNRIHIHTHTYTQIKYKHPFMYLIRISSGRIFCSIKNVKDCRTRIRFWLPSYPHPCSRPEWSCHCLQIGAPARPTNGSRIRYDPKISYNRITVPLVQAECCLLWIWTDLR